MEALRLWAEREGRLSGFEELTWPPDAFGFEHEVWFPKAGGERPRVWKATYPNSFGVMPDGIEPAPIGYLERLQLQNRIFGDDIQLEGVLEPSFALIRIITSQPAIQGRPAKAEEIAAFFTQHGFARCILHDKSVWFRSADRVICADTHGGNVLATKAGAMVAIDVPVIQAPTNFEP
jgi:hypothetical protein